jgi:chromate transporter
MMMIVAIGQWVAGPLGALAVVLAFFGPTALFAFFIGRLWKKLERWPWRASIQRGLAPVAIGLLLAGCFSMAKGVIFGVETAAIAVVTLLVLLHYRINPALLVLAGAIVGAYSFAPK